MKNKNQGNFEESEQQDNALNEIANIQLSEKDKEKGNLKNFNISKKTIKKLKARNIEYLFPVQSGSYTSIYEQKDCLIQSSNGTGKTLAFVIPIVEYLQNDNSIELTSGRAPRVLVLAPTKDIGKQISDDFQSIVNDLTVVSIYTTKKKSDDQETGLSNGCDILVATPDRLKEFIDNEKVNLSELKHVVLDEMDRMLESDIMDNIKKILKTAFTTDEETKAQLIVFSETMPDSVRKLTKKYLSDDVVSVNLLDQNNQKASADDDDEEEEEEEEKSDESAENGNSSVSLLTKQENYTTYQLTTNEEIKGVGFVFAVLRRCLGADFDAKSTVSQIAFTKDFTSAVFDLPSEHDEQLQSAWKDDARTKLGPITRLPELDESSMNNNNKGYSGGNNRSPRGGAGGNRNNTGRSSGCFKCGKDGHKSFECPDANGSQRNSGKRSGGGGGCFNCGKDGHKSFECPEPKKAGGGGGNACFNCGKDGHKSFECSEPKKAGGGRSGGSNACFNCGQEGHRSFECTEPKKAGGGGGGGNACFNCGKDGHKSFDCPEPKKGRGSFGGGPRGGGGGRGGGAKRSFGGANTNAQTSGDTTNKKIKFDDDDDE